jgi:hypothetical protein
MHNWNIFDAHMNHEQTWTHNTHKIHHGLNLGEPPPSPLYYSMCLAIGAQPKYHFVPRPPSQESRNFRNWDFHHFGNP